jgi:hypothetical protein
MKKRIKKMVLTKETLRELTDWHSKVVWGGQSGDTCPRFPIDLNAGPGMLCEANETLG